jgi:tetratricopeptide (TPR) repeat protein
MRQTLLVLLLLQRLSSADLPEGVHWNDLLARAEQLREQGLYREAQAVTKQVVRTSEGFGSMDRRYAFALNLSGLVHRDLGKYPEAERDYLRALRMLEKCACDPRLLSQLLQNLASLYIDLGGREAQSERLFRRALQISLSDLPPDHPEVGGLLSNLAASLTARRRYPEATSYYRQALTIFEANPRFYAPSIAITLTNQAVLLAHQGQSGDAIPVLKRAIGILEEALGSGHPSLVKPLLNLGRTYLRVDHAAMAVEPLSRATEIAINALGPEHPTLGDVLETYGAALRKTGRKREARVIGSQVEAIRHASPSGTRTLSIHVADLYPRPKKHR